MAESTRAGAAEVASEDLLGARIAAINSIVERYSKRHMKMDVAIGVAGIVPGLATASIIGAIAVQGPLVYQPMVREIGKVFEAGFGEPDRRIAAEGNLLGATYDLAAEFGVSFLKESTRELITEHGIALGLSWIPFVGGIVAAGLDVVIARKMTRLVGAMAVLYYENERAWLGSRKKTRAIVLTSLKTNPAASMFTIVESILREQGVRPERKAGHQRTASTAEMDNAAAVADGTLQAAPLSADADHISPFVLDALERWREIDYHTVSGIVAGFSSGATFMEAGVMGNVKGYTGEQIASTELHSPLPDDPTQPAWDLPYDDKLWQIKVGSTAYNRAVESLHKYPENPIISDEATAERLAAGGHEALGLHDLANDHLVDLTNQTAVSIADLAHIAPGVPVISGIVVTVQQLERVRKSEIGISEAVANITAAVGSREGAMLLCATVSVGVAAAAGLLPVAGPFIAGATVTGALGGREIGERLMHMRIPGLIAARLTAALQRNNLTTAGSTASA
jgi:hypothetical protein